MATLKLSGSVGKGGDNKPADVKLVRARFRELGYHKVTAEGRGDDKDFVETIRFFQALVDGMKDRVKISKYDGLINAKGDTHKWLAAKNAPAWVEVYGKSGTGWSTTFRPIKDGVVNDVPELWTNKHKFTFSGGTPYTYLNGGFATSWLRDLVRDVGRAYAAALPDAPPIWLRDCSPKDYGSNARGHASHEFGRSADFRLPLLEEEMEQGDKPFQELSSKRARQDKLDRKALEKQLELLSNEKKAGKLDIVIFKDDTNASGTTPLHAEYRTRVKDPKVWNNHKNHIHIRVAVPKRIEGVFG